MKHLADVVAELYVGHVRFLEAQRKNEGRFANTPQNQAYRPEREDTCEP